MSPRFAAIAGVCALASLLVGHANADPMYFTADLTPLNSSGVYAHFDLTLDGNLLTVSEHATGLEPNEPHPQHIHGMLGADAPNTTLATLANDTDHDGYVNMAEGQAAYGPILIPLSSPPGGALSDFPTAPGGVINFQQTYNLSDSSVFAPGISESDLFPLTDRVIAIHGLTAPVGVETGTPGASEVYDPVLPVADGFIRAVSVPEPSSLALLLVGMAGCWWAARRRRTG